MRATTRPNVHVIRVTSDNKQTNKQTWTTWKLEPLVTGLVVPLGPLLQGILETPGLTVGGHLVHGQVKVVPSSSIPYLCYDSCQWLIKLNK